MRVLGVIHRIPCAKNGGDLTTQFLGRAGKVDASE